MFSWLANAWRVPELRKRVLFTFMILAFYRLGPGSQRRASTRRRSRTTSTAAAARSSGC